MALSKKRKEELVASYSELIQKSRGMILAEYKGLDMAGMNKVRAAVRDARGEFHITKNTLTELALKRAGLPVPGEKLTQTNAVGFAFEDVPGVARALVDFARESQFVAIKGGLLGSRALSPDDVTVLAELPPMPVVRARLLGVINAPARNLASVVAGSVRQVINVVKAYSEKGNVPAEAAA
ncbi:MAG: 50S ribosomal protein L10 [Chloroflexi bacterium]|nr:50S ribosomal protein L10 [Chloroflexota bacterium]